MAIQNREPLCPVFNRCGGCLYQHLSYSEELSVKERELHSLFEKEFELGVEIFEPIVASPKEYHYRHRLNLALRRKKKDEVVIGFTSKPPYQAISVESCAIADERISSILPELKKEFLTTLPLNYRTANLVIKVGDDGRVFWGGIGRNSLKLDPSHYFWTEIHGKKIFYSLDTFFQANLSILPLVLKTMKELVSFSSTDTLFLDLYGGVGLFSILLADQIKRAVIVEENPSSVRLAEFNIQYHQLPHLSVCLGSVEKKLGEILEQSISEQIITLVDPPRKGLELEVSENLAKNETMDQLLYLSCNPKSLVVDLKKLVGRNWQIQKIIPFDFFPKTPHLETLVLLKNRFTSSCSASSSSLKPLKQSAEKSPRAIEEPLRRELKQSQT